MKAFNVTTTPQLIVAAGNRDFVHIYNNSDEILYLKYDGSASTLSTSNGFPLAVGGILTLNNDGQRNLFNKEVWGVHGGTGNKEVRVAGVD